MKSSAFYAILGVGLIVAVCIIWWGTAEHMRNAPKTATSTPQAATSTQSLTGMSIYTNGQYGFALFYPSSDVATSTFATYYHLPNQWRVGATRNASGTPVIAIIGYQTQSDTSYPRYFDTEVRVGVSGDQAELKVCNQVGDGELPQQPVTINGVQWGVYAFESAGMMQYVKGVSYRTIHNGKCFAVEQLETGSSYINDKPSPNDIPQSTLDAHYAALQSIVQSFSFVH